MTAFTLHERTPEEHRDMFKAWNRSDEAFFASGACHILAHQFLSLHPDEGYVLVWIRTKNNLPGNHYIASNGTRMFDFSGYNDEAAYLADMRSVYRDRYGPGWEYDRIEIPEGLVEHLKGAEHKLRPPEWFPELPWRRAYDYIQRLELS